MKKNIEATENVAEQTPYMIPFNLQYFASSDDADDDTDIDDEGEGTQYDEGDDGDQDVNKSGKKTGTTAGGKKNTGGQMFTQAQVNRMMSREKKQGRNSILKELGVKDPNEAAKAIKAFKAFQDSQKTDEQRTADAEQEQLLKVQEANERAMKAEAKAEAMVLGAKPDCVDDVIVLAMAKYTDDADFKTLITEIKTKYPALFKASDEGGEDRKKDKVGLKGTGNSIKGGKTNTNDEKSLGSRLAAQRKRNQTKVSHFVKKS